MKKKTKDASVSYEKNLIPDKNKNSAASLQGPPTLEYSAKQPSASKNVNTNENPSDNIVGVEEDSLDTLAQQQLQGKIQVN